MDWRPLVAIAIAVTLFLAAWGAVWVFGPTSAGERIHIRHDGLERSYLLHIPNDVAANASLVLVLHGAGDFAKRIAEATLWSDLADENGFIVAYPEGTSHPLPRWREAWNAGHCCFHATRDKVDDVGFLHAVINDIRDRHDVGAIHMAGFSNGGMMAYRFAVESPGTLSAIGSVAAAIQSGWTEDKPAWQPPPQTAPIPVIHFHGRDDAVVPFDGGIGSKLTGWHWASVNDTLDYWAHQWNVTTAGPTPLTDTVDLRTWHAGGRVVVAAYLHAAGHSWPGSSVPWFLTEPEPSIDATRLMWDFFKRAEER